MSQFIGVTKEVLSVWWFLGSRLILGVIVFFTLVVALLTLIIASTPSNQINVRAPERITHLLESKSSLFKEGGRHGLQINRWVSDKRYYHCYLISGEEYCDMVTAYVFVNDSKFVSHFYGSRADLISNGVRIHTSQAFKASSLYRIIPVYQMPIRERLESKICDPRLDRPLEGADIADLKDGILSRGDWCVRQELKEF
ncbi:hypothetical protein [Vibrio alginolyticus]|uniref:hypothetical protein n=1 Tax=Vibrio alginolyticus TaxID=663 RepID=UPI0006CA7723|nr:hypothetical protein [Vibrio alginolyticus]KPM97624.1 hypothetical protein AOG25_14270 [Vibrio alginolyticus]CAH7205448.1 conserved hypothetical protein [Vibrio chagasii]CAH7373129.1 conserved hypothetical protein [Vibrio chagasii]